jgi:hypothetical protein
MRFEVMTVSMKVTVFFDVVLFILLQIYQCFRDAYCLCHRGDEGSDDGSSVHPRNISKSVP